MALEKQKLMICFIVILVVIYFLSSKEGFGMPDSKYNYFDRKCGQIEGFGIPNSRLNYFQRPCVTLNKNINSSDDKVEGFACPCAARINSPYYRLANGYQKYEDFESMDSENKSIKIKGAIKTEGDKYIWINDDGSLSLNEDIQVTKPLDFVIQDYTNNNFDINNVVGSIDYGISNVVSFEKPYENRSVILTIVHPNSSKSTTGGLNIFVDNINKLMYIIDVGKIYYVDSKLKWTLDIKKAGKFNFVMANIPNLLPLSPVLGKPNIFVDNSNGIMYTMVVDKLYYVDTEFKWTTDFQKAGKFNFIMVNNPNITPISPSTPPQST